MEKLKLKHESLTDTLARLGESVEIGAKLRQDASQERAWLMARDSMIKRFEFSCELFWKYVKKYLDEVLVVTPSVVSPLRVIRAACQAALIEVEDGETFIQMIKDRNETSHMYKEEIADRISTKIPSYYQLMKEYAEKLTPEG